ncbi:MAG: riboflavin synthase [Fimbriimonadaceae bacterium]|nr:riboflavin synthase [Chitinophagales bacterium]
MFTGIIETFGTVVHLQQENSNLHITIQSSITSELKIDQSISHNGVCLTVVAINNDTYSVTAVDETLQKSNLRKLKIRDAINLERCLKIGDRLDGHIVQGHVDLTVQLINIEDKNGSYFFTFSFDKNYAKYIVEKGSICVNGISLTIVHAKENEFSVAIIPYTWENTNLKQLKIYDDVNLEFDVIGKYVERMMKQ